jgi:hypothetical protein
MEVKTEVFILFDKKDRDLFLELKEHLAPLETQGLITIWDEEGIVGGRNRRQEIDSHLQSAPLVLPLISARFMASRESYELTKHALATHTPPQGYVVPVLLHEVDWEHSDFGPLKPLPTNKKPISRWSNRHAAFLDVVKGVRAIIEDYKQSLTPLPISATQNKLGKRMGTSNSAKGKPDRDVNHLVTEPANLLHLTISTPDGNKYTTDVPADTLVDRLLHDFLSEWLSTFETIGSMHFSLRTEDAASLTLDPSNTLREAGLAADATLTLISEVLGPNDFIGLKVEDDGGEYYTTNVPLNTAVGRLADAFLETKSGTGKAVVKWILSTTKTQQLRPEESLYDQGVCDDALLRIYRVAEAAEE